MDTVGRTDPCDRTTAMTDGEDVKDPDDVALPHTDGDNHASGAYTVDALNHA